MLVPSISICVLSQALFHNPALLHLDFRPRDSAAKLTLTDHLQVHLLQLKHLQVTAETVYNATPAEQWVYFLKNAETLTMEEVRQSFPINRPRANRVRSPDSALCRNVRRRDSQVAE